MVSELRGKAAIVGTGHAGFGGFAIHHFESYVEWLAAQ